MLNISIGVSQSFGGPQLRILCLALSSILIGLFGSLESNFLSSLYILDIRPLLECRVVKDLFPIYWLAFCPIDSVFYLTEAL